jgi:hypothetical protein
MHQMLERWLLLSCLPLTLAAKSPAKGPFKGPPWASGGGPPWASGGGPPWASGGGPPWASGGGPPWASGGGPPWASGGPPGINPPFPKTPGPSAPANSTRPAVILQKCASPEDIHPRLEIRDLEKDPDQWNIFLLGFQKMKQMNSSDLLSYYAISGRSNVSPH